MKLSQKDLKAIVMRQAVESTRGAREEEVRRLNTEFACINRSIREAFSAVESTEKAIIQAVGKRMEKSPQYKTIIDFLISQGIRHSRAEEWQCAEIRELVKGTHDSLSKMFAPLPADCKLYVVFMTGHYASLKIYFPLSKAEEHRWQRVQDKKTAADSKTFRQSEIRARLDTLRESRLSPERKEAAFQDMLLADLDADTRDTLDALAAKLGERLLKTVGITEPGKTK